MKVLALSLFLCFTFALQGQQKPQEEKLGQIVAVKRTITVTADDCRLKYTTMGYECVADFFDAEDSSENLVKVQLISKDEDDTDKSDEQWESSLINERVEDINLGVAFEKTFTPTGYIVRIVRLKDKNLGNPRDVADRALKKHLRGSYDVNLLVYKILQK